MEKNCKTCKHSIRNNKAVDIYGEKCNSSYINYEYFKGETKMFKVGDKVKYIGHSEGQFFTYGDIYIIGKISNQYIYPTKYLNKENCNGSFEDFQLIKDTISRKKIAKLLAEDPCEEAIHQALYIFWRMGDKECSEILHGDILIIDLLNKYLPVGDDNQTKTWLKKNGYAVEDKSEMKQKVEKQMKSFEEKLNDFSKNLKELKKEFGL